MRTIRSAMSQNEFVSTARAMRLRLHKATAPLSAELFRPIGKYSIPWAATIRGSYRLRPSKITGVLELRLSAPSKSGLRNSFHSVTMASASAPSQAAKALVANETRGSAA